MPLAKAREKGSKEIASIAASPGTERRIVLNPGRMEKEGDNHSTTCHYKHCSTKEKAKEREDIKKAKEEDSKESVSIAGR